jgi:hypothetical protein
MYVYVACVPECYPYHTPALYVIRVPYIVASQLKILIPVGTSIIIVADVK